MISTKEEINDSVRNLKELKDVTCDPFSKSIDIAIEALDELLCPSCGDIDDRCLCDMEG